MGQPSSVLFFISIVLVSQAFLSDFLGAREGAANTAGQAARPREGCSDLSASQDGPSGASCEAANARPYLTCI